MRIQHTQIVPAGIIVAKESHVCPACSAGVLGVSTVSEETEMDAPQVTSMSVADVTMKIYTTQLSPPANLAWPLPMLVKDTTRELDGR